jgi:predicted RNA-binding protein YlqC (UPF0109 family)
MKDLLTFLVKNIIGSEDFSVSEEANADSISLTVSSKPEHLGLIIGKEGRTIKNLRKILSIRAVPEKKSVSINITESTKKTD